MLSVEENHTLTQVDRGTPMGELLRRFWIPVLPASHLPTPNGDPVRLTIAGERLVAWRDGDGRVGIFDEFCMHRGASLALGRCEGDGLRCIYHGWKFAVDGKILETPNFRGSSIRDRMRAPAWPVREAGGLIWAYLGPRDKEPPFPHYAFMDSNAELLPIYYAVIDANWVQVMEGAIDPSHRLILHRDTLGPTYTNTIGGGLASGIEGTTFVSEDLAPECEVEDTLFGCHGVAFLEATVDGDPGIYARAHTWIMPFLALASRESFVFTIPLDHHRCAMIGLVTDEFVDDDERDRELERLFRGPIESYVNFRFRFGADERWGQDRDRMSSTFTGVEGTVPEDSAMCLSMGEVFDRSREHLVPSDGLIIRMRRHLLRAAKELQSGTDPFMLSPEEAYQLGGNGQLIDSTQDWVEKMLPGNVDFRVESASQKDASSAESIKAR